MRNLTLRTNLSGETRSNTFAPVLILCGLVAAGIVVWRVISTAGNPNPLAPDTSSSAAVLDIGVLVFREGLECVLVLAAITAGTAGKAGDLPVIRLRLGWELRLSQQC